MVARARSRAKLTHENQEAERDNACDSGFPPGSLPYWTVLLTFREGHPSLGSQRWKHPHRNTRGVL
jgi:hypothetical protein